MKTATIAGNVYSYKNTITIGSITVNNKTNKHNIRNETRNENVAAAAKTKMRPNYDPAAQLDAENLTITMLVSGLRGMKAQQ